MGRARTLNFFDLVAMMFAAWYSLELIATLGSMGWSMITLLIFFMLFFFGSQAMIVSELGSTYPDQGGIYAWIKRAFGDRWAARTTWWYWFNIAAYVPSMMVVTGSVVTHLFWPDMPVWGMLILSVTLTWVLVGFNCMKLADSKWLPTISSFAKAGVCLALVGGAVYWLATKGSATPFTWGSMVPDVGSGLQFVALIGIFVYAFSGADIMCAAAEEMEDPARDIPRSMLSAGTITLVLYIVTASALLVVLPQASGISESNGFVEALGVVYGGSKFVMYLLGAMTVLAFFGSMATWTIGGNRAAQEAGEAGELPAVFARTNSHGSPVGASILIGIASTVLLCVYGLTAGTNDALFWSLLAFGSIIFFMPYIVMCFAFLHLRRHDPHTPRPFRIPGGLGTARAFAYTCAGFLAVACLAFLLPQVTGDTYLNYTLPLVVGVILVVGAGEIIVSRSLARRDRLAADGEAGPGPEGGGPGGVAVVGAGAEDGPPGPEADRD